MNAQVSIINTSTVCTDKEVSAMLPALQAQVSNDFAPVWGRDAILAFYGKGTPPPADSWWLTVLDTSDQAGALGYHDVTPAGLPLGKVFAKSDKDNGSSVSVTISHELLEMLADPEINGCTLIETQSHASIHRLLYATEVCDAVEADSLGYQGAGGIQLSDFIYPAWFMPSIGKKFDHMERLTSALSLAPGGYTSVMHLGGRDRWKQVFAEEGEHPQPPIGSRRERRTRRRSWRFSKV